MMSVEHEINVKTVDTDRFQSRDWRMRLAPLLG